jgi:hypothetical protein
LVVVVESFAVGWRLPDNGADIIDGNTGDDFIVGDAFASF